MVLHPPWMLLSKGGRCREGHKDGDAWEGGEGTREGGRGGRTGWESALAMLSVQNIVLMHANLLDLTSLYLKK